jgi:hypothetical protein
MNVIGASSPNLADAPRRAGSFARIPYYYGYLAPRAETV